MSGPTVGDVVAFEALPEDVQMLARRVLGPQPPAVDAIAAYLAGWEDCGDDMHAPNPPNRQQVEARLTRKDHR